MGGADKSARPTYADSVFPQEALAIVFVPESFCSSWLRHGKRTRAVAAGQAGLKIGAAKIFMQETSVKTVPGSNRINRRDLP